MTFIEQLAAKRRQLLDGINANEGDINLRIFEDFYPDEAHFIFELLQNAEDTGATEVAFELETDGCVFTHNGRHFNESDIKAITGIFNSSKKEESDKIGKFGVGFKSVFVYTETPIVYSDRYSFKISNLILPESVEPKSGNAGTTRFELPFNSSKKSAAEAYAEVKNGLEQLSDMTLIFLSNLRCVRWKVGQRSCTIQRSEHSDVHIEVIRDAGPDCIASSHWLRFNSPVDGGIGTSRCVGTRTVAVAYELQPTSDATQFDPEQLLAKQLRIVPASPGRVAVFFPAEKETSGLRFHLHAPFVPELSRASIKNTPANDPLIAQLASLAAISLHTIRDLGLLTPDFLAVLPNKNDPIPPKYAVVRERIIREMQEQSLTPTFNKGHAPAKLLLQARAALKDLLSSEDIAFLLSRTDSAQWAINASQRNSDADRFLQALEIQPWDTAAFIEVIRAKSCRGVQYQAGSEMVPFVNWLSRKSDEWHQQLYALLYRELNNEYEYVFLRNAVIIKTHKNGYSIARNVYFPSEMDNEDDHFLRVAHGIIDADTKKSQQADAIQFLKKMGVSVIGESELVVTALRKRYASPHDVKENESYISDIKRFITYLEQNPHNAEVFEQAYLFRINGKTDEWARAKQVYIDTPFEQTYLTAYHERLAEGTMRRWALSVWYIGCGLDIEKFLAFAKAVGCSSRFSEMLVETTCDKNLNWDYLRRAPGERWTKPIDRDYALSITARSFLQAKNIEFARLVWHTMGQLNSVRPTCLSAVYQKTERGGARRSESTLLHQLKELEWVPLQNGQFVKPADATASELLQGFEYGSELEWLKQVKFGVSALNRSLEHQEAERRRAALGFTTDAEYRRAKAFIALPLEIQERVLDEITQQQQNTSSLESFPERPIRNAQFRHARVREQSAAMPEKEVRMANRTVPVDADAAKLDTRLYLQEQYTNQNHVMYCQICKGPLPFKLPNGAYYFEAVELIPGQIKRYRESYLSLCPNHAAMFIYANEQREMMRELIEVLAGTELPITLAKQQVTVQFTEMHLADIKSV